MDILVVAKTSIPVNPLRRLDLVAERLAEVPGVECILLTPLEFKILVKKRNSVALSALRERSRSWGCSKYSQYGLVASILLSKIPVRFYMYEQSNCSSMQ